MSTATVYGARWLTDWLDLALAWDRGQGTEARRRVELWVSTFLVMTSQTLSFFVLGYITKSTVMICPSVKIYDIFFFFHYLRVHRVDAALASCLRSEEKKKDTARTPKSHESFHYPCPTRVERQDVAKNDVSVQPRPKVVGMRQL